MWDYSSWMQLHFREYSIVVWNVVPPCPGLKDKVTLSTNFSFPLLFPDLDHILLCIILRALSQIKKKEKVIIFSAANTQFRAKEQNKYVVMKSFQENNLWNTLQSDCLLVICKFAGHASMLFHISVSPSLVLIHLYKFIQTFPPMLIVLTGLFSYLYCVDVFLIMFRIMFRNIIKLRNAHYYYYYLLLLYSFREVECGGFYEKSFVIARSLSISPWNFLYSTMVSVPIVQNRQLHEWFMNILFSLFLYHMSIESTSAKNYRYISLHN
jgi:hypothetical protein